MNSKSQTSASHDWWLVLVYVLLALVLTWPTITQPATHLPGDGADDPAIAWNMWWVKHALLNEAQIPFQTDFMFYPVGINLAFYTLTVLNAVTALPLILNLGVVTASNVHMYFTFAIGGYGAYLLTRYVLARTGDDSRLVESHQQPVSGRLSLTWLSAAIAGGFYAFASSKLFYIALGQFNIGSSHWIPFAALYVLRTHHQPRRLKNPLMAGLFLTFQAWAEMTYATFLLVFIALYWLYWVIIYTSNHLRTSHTMQSAGFPAPVPHLRAALILGLTFTLGLSPILAQILPDMLIEGDFLVEGSGFAGPFSADLLGFLIPTIRHPWLGNLIRQTNVQHFSLGQHIYIGFVLLGLLLVNLYAIYRSPKLRFWLIAATFFALLSLGPQIIVNGQATGVAGPFIVFQQLPFFRGNRYPSRYSVMVMLSLSVLAGFGLRHFSLRFSPWKRAQLVAFIALLFLFEHLAVPLPQSDMRVPAPYYTIFDDPGDFVLLDIPFAWRNGFSVIGAQTTQFMFGQFYQTVHQKRLLQGNTSRNPEFKFQYFTRAPIINSLLALETGKTLLPEQWAADQAIAAEVLRFFNIKYIVVRPYSYNWSNGQENITATEQGTIPYIEEVFPVDKIHDGAAIKIYQVKEQCGMACDFQSAEGARSKSGLLINTNSLLAPLTFAEGWGLLSKGRPITAQRRNVRLLLPLSDAAQQLNLRMRLPQAYQAAAQTVWLELDGWQSPPQMVGRAWAEYTFEIPAGVTQSGLNELWLHFANLTDLPPPHPDTPPLDVTTVSTGEDVGGFGRIFVNGHDVSPNERGYNVALIRPGQLPEISSFDTNAEPAASTALAEFVKTLNPEGLIAVAVADEASQSLEEEAVLALQALGASADLRGCFRCSHALISQGGEATEAFDPLRPAGVTTSLGLTEPSVAAVVEWVRVEAVED